MVKKANKGTVLFFLLSLLSFTDRLIKNPYTEAFSGLCAIIACITIVVVLIRVNIEEHKKITLASVLETIFFILLGALTAWLFLY